MAVLFDFRVALFPTREVVGTGAGSLAGAEVDLLPIPDAWFASAVGFAGDGRLNVMAEDYVLTPRRSLVTLNCRTDDGANNRDSVLLNKRVLH